MIPFASDTRELRRPVAEHEIVFSFASDWIAEAFSDWWAGAGRELFANYADAHEGDYR